MLFCKRRAPRILQAGQKSLPGLVDFGASQELAWIWRTGRIQSAERAKPTLQQLDIDNLTNLLSA